MKLTNKQKREVKEAISNELGLFDGLDGAFQYVAGREMTIEESSYADEVIFRLRAILEK